MAATDNAAKAIVDTVYLQSFSDLPPISVSIPEGYTLSLCQVYPPQQFCIYTPYHLYPYLERGTVDSFINSIPNWMEGLNMDTAIYQAKVVMVQYWMDYHGYDEYNSSNFDTVYVQKLREYGLSLEADLHLKFLTKKQEIRRKTLEYVRQKNTPQAKGEWILKNQGKEVEYSGPYQEHMSFIARHYLNDKWINPNLNLSVYLLSHGIILSKVAPHMWVREHNGQGKIQGLSNIMPQIHNGEIQPGYDIQMLLDYIASNMDYKVWCDTIDQLRPSIVEQAVANS